MNVDIKIIPHKKQRYSTVGDWFFDKNGNLKIKVSKMSDVRYELLVAVHELVEALLCDNNGVDEDDVTKFDVEFERNRKEGDDRESGDQPEAPYYKEHLFATEIEKMLVEKLEVNWIEYEKEINSL